jgi:hypothetical protein
MYMGWRELGGGAVGGRISNGLGRLRGEWRGINKEVL